MTTQKLRAGVIGCGQGASHGYAYAHAPEFELAAICDLKSDVIDTFFERSRLKRGSVRLSHGLIYWHPTPGVY